MGFAPIMMRMDVSCMHEYYRFRRNEVGSGTVLVHDPIGFDPTRSTAFIENQSLLITNHPTSITDLPILTRRSPKPILRCPLVFSIGNLLKFIEEKPLWISRLYYRQGCPRKKEKPTNPFFKITNLTAYK